MAHPIQSPTPAPAPRIIAGILVFLGLLIVWYNQTGNDTDDPLPPSSHSFKVTFPPNKIVDGTLGSIPYYHCAADMESVEPSQVKDIVLLHGSKFTKEDWKTSQILSLLCSYSQTSVTAFDLSVRSDSDALIPLIQRMPGENLVSQLPITGLVTPSASGYAVVSGIQQGKVGQLQQVIGMWIPVASGSVSQLQTSQLIAVKDSHWPVWAIYGDKDVGGRQVSTTLANEAGASVQEFTGGHPFYLSTPNEFVSALCQKLGITK